MEKVSSCRSPARLSHTAALEPTSQLWVPIGMVLPVGCASRRNFLGFLKNTVICGYSDTFPAGLNCSRT